VRAADVRQAALTLFAERGYHGTSMKDIAAALGLRAPSLYNHLDSKQSLLQEIMLGTMEKLIRELDAVLATTTDLVEQLRRVMEAHVRFHTRFHTLSSRLLSGAGAGRVRVDRATRVQRTDRSVTQPHAGRIGETSYPCALRGRLCAAGTAETS
jgi:AcrR family transcriptional regulator